MKIRKVKQSKLNLLPEHLDDLRKSGLTDKTIQDAKLFSADRLVIRQLLGYAPPKVESALVFPYGDDFYRLKIFPSFKNSNGSTTRYLQPKGTPPRLYIPKFAKGYLKDAKLLLHITEGEKKALAACQHGLPCIGIGGVWSWLYKNKPIADLDKIAWNGRRIAIVGDSDVFLPTRKDLQLAVYALAKEIESRGAVADLIVYDTEIEL